MTMAEPSNAPPHEPDGAEEPRPLSAGTPPVLAGLRRPGDEAQFTQVIGALGARDATFAAGYARSLLHAAAARKQFARSVSAFGDVPSDLECRPEFSLSAEAERHGRVDVRLSAPRFSLLVEHKLYSAFSHDQLQRYGRYVRAAPPGERHGLIAVTRAVPTDEALNAPEGLGWLGVVRWMDLLDDLRQLDHHDSAARAQWRALLDIMLKQGDLGVAKADKKLVDAWGYQAVARDHLADILGQVREAADEVVHKALDGRLRRHGGSATVGAFTHGKTKLTVKRTAGDVWIAWEIPPGSGPTLGLGFLPDYVTRETVLYTNVRPLNVAARRLTDAALRRAVDDLGSRGFSSEKDLLRRKYPPSEWADAADVGVRVIELFAGDVSAIAETGILRGQFPTKTPPKQPSKRAKSRFGLGR